MLTSTFVAVGLVLLYLATKSGTAVLAAVAFYVAFLLALSVILNAIEAAKDEILKKLDR